MPFASPPTRRGIARWGLFLLCWGLTAALVGRQAGFPEMGTLEDKLRHFAVHGDEYDVIFVGSSRIERGVVPPVFDAELAARGRPLRSFNFGVAGMEAHEANALMRRMLASEPARLRWVVVELEGWDPVLENENRFKRRAVFWHDAAETWSALRSTAALEAPLAARADLASTHLLHFAARLLALGRGPDAVRSLARTAGQTSPDLERWQGFKPYTESSYRYNPLRKHFLDHPDDYREAIRRLEDGAGVAASPADVAAVRAQVAMIRRVGRRSVHLVPPSPRAVPRLAEHVPALLAFNRPRDYGELFAVDQRFDHEHLTQEGAERFTRLLAARFAAEVLDEEPDRLAALGR
jgi:hypothetical protein